nr:helix-hairpin-helix domain-containing protein [Saprospiraceae bacterium]
MQLNCTKTAFLLLTLCYSITSIAQVDTDIESTQQDIIEDFIQNTGEESDFDFITLTENLRYAAEHPVNLNKATYEELLDLTLLSDLQINSLIDYRQKVGDLINIYELQAVPNWDVPTIKKILPFVAVSGDFKDFNVPIARMMSQGKNDLFLRFRRQLEEQKGYTLPPDIGYLGDRNQYFMRYRHTYENRLSWGFTAEKDPGEEFFKGSNKFGFDFYSAHFFLKDYNSWLKALAIGDYAVNMGQGLILYSGFASGKNAFVTKIRRGGRTLRPFTSVNEFIFNRGAAATINISKKIELTAFASFLKKDGNVQISSDTLNDNFDDFSVSSLLISGLHRTQNEIADKHQLLQTTFGAVVKYKLQRGHVAFNILNDRFSRSLIRNPEVYNQYYFSGNNLFNASIDYNYIFQNFNFFGEIASSDNAGVAVVNGLLVGLSRQGNSAVDLAIHHRYLGVKYQALLPNPFAETGQGSNEHGLYVGLEIKPNINWQLSTYFDIWKHPWLRYNADAPSHGNEFFSRLTYNIKRQLEIYFQYRIENKQINTPESFEKIDYLSNTQRQQLRLNVINKV